MFNIPMNQDKNAVAELSSKAFKKPFIAKKVKI